MRIDVTKSEFQTIVDALGGQILKCDQKNAALLRLRLQWQLSGKGPDDPKRNFVPIRSGFPNSLYKSTKKRNWAYKKPKAPKAAKPSKIRQAGPPPKTAEEILAEL